MSGKHQAIFVEANGNGPWPCDFCGEDVIALTFDLGLVHHRDENHGNNEPENLVAMHRPCHARHHLTGKPRTAETAMKISKARTGMKFSDVTKRRISEAKRGKKQPPEAVEKRRQKMLGRTYTPEHRAAISAGRRAGAARRAAKDTDV